MQGFVARKALEAISPYVAGKPIEETARQYGLNPTCIVKLASNENPLGMSPKAQQAAMQALTNGTRYPDGAAQVVREAAAAFAGVSPDEVIVGNGSDEILGLIARTVLSPGDRCVYSQYSFSVYELSAQECAAECVEVPTKDFQVDLEGLLAATDINTRLIYITNPNNPTGLPLDPGALLTFLERVPEKCVVVLDEAYTDFMDEKLRTPSFEWVKRFPNLLVTRTFSKAYGLAGLRAGFGVANKELIEMMNRIRPPFNMNAAAQAAAVAALEDQAFLRKVVQTNAKERARLAAFFDELKLVQLPSQANFIMVHVGPEAAEINEAMLRKGVILRPLKSYGLPEYMRISVGSPEENDIFMTAFRETLSALCVFAKKGNLTMRLALIGVGLIGASAAWAMKRGGVFDTVSAFDLSTKSVRKAVDMGIADAASSTLQECVQGADAVLVAVPVLAIEKVMAQIEPFLGDDTLITDVGSVRGVVIDGARRVLKEKFVNYAPVHPIAGGEMPGVDYADADLFVGAKAISTPVDGIGERAVRFWEEAWKTAGSDLLRMTPEEHDAVFASVSHLPHLLSYAMVDSILNTGSAERKLSLAGAGFRDFTRIAASSPEMWVDIFRANKKAVLEALSYFEKDLALLRRAVENDEVEVTRSVFARAADARRRIAPHLPKKRS